jgi:hypothetical protein
MESGRDILHCNKQMLSLSKDLPEAVCGGGLLLLQGQRDPLFAGP